MFNSLKKSILFFSLSFVVLFTGCKKDEDPPVCDLNATNLAGSYTLTSVNFNGMEVLNDTTYFDACSKDDVYTFLANGTYTVTEGQVSCSPATVDNGTWTLTGTSLDLDGEAGQVSAFSCSGFSYTLSLTDPVPVNVVFKFARQ